MFWNSLQVYSGIIRHRLLLLSRQQQQQQTNIFATTTPHLPAFSPIFVPQLAGCETSLSQQDTNNDIHSWIWFAVPKRKHSRSRKRMKTTVQKRLVVKKNIVFDPRTGEVTLKHKLPFNWKEYLPKVE